MNNKDKELIINEIRKNKPLFDLDDNFMLYITKGYNNLYDKINTSSFKEILECNDCNLLCELLSKYSLESFFVCSRIL